MNFPRSFVFSTEAFPLPAGHVPVELPHGYLSATSDYTVEVAARGADQLILLGYAIDLRDIGSLNHQVAERLLDTGVTHNRDAMLQESDYLLGRFAAMVRLRGEWFVFNDACATRSIYFADESPIIASHSTLIGRIFNSQPQMELYSHFRFGMPGNRSIFPGVRILPANFWLDLKTHRIHRFWPRHKRIERSPGELLRPLDELLGKASRAIAGRWPSPIVSVTAGLDSRVTLAAFRDHAEAVFFTYARGDMDNVDVGIARAMCDRLGREHRTMTMVAKARAISIYETIAAMHDHTHIRAVPASYLEYFSGPGRIHVRSTLAEIGRAFWRQHTGTARLTPAKLVRMIERMTERNEAGHDQALGFGLQAFEQFFSDAGYENFDPEDPLILDYDAWDLLYWEHRMPTWHAQVLMGSDFAFDTVILFNSRLVLDLLLAAPRTDRLRATLLRRYVQEKCPDFENIPVNPNVMPKDLVHLTPHSRAAERGDLTQGSS